MLPGSLVTSEVLVAIPEYLIVSVGTLVARMQVLIITIEETDQEGSMTRIRLEPVIGIADMPCIMSSASEAPPHPANKRITCAHKQYLLLPVHCPMQDVL